MNALIPIRHSGSKPAVNARDLHAFLEIGKDFSTWIKSRIEDFGFVENQDFAIFPETGENPGRPRIEYALSLDMAKELAMIENNSEGRKVRRQLIKIEEEYRQMLLNENRVKSPKEIELKSFSLANPFFIK